MNQAADEALDDVGIPDRAPAAGTGSDAAGVLVLGSPRRVHELATDVVSASVDVRAARVGRIQHGRASRAQLAALGIAGRTIQRRVTAGIWGAHPGGVVDLGTHGPSWEQELATALLAAGADQGTAWASHLTAAYLHGFLDVEPPQRLAVTVPRSRRPSPRKGQIHRVRALPADERTIVLGMPATSAARTILDIAATVPVDRLEPLLWEASRHRPALTLELARCGTRWPYHRGRSAVQGLLRDLHPQFAEVESPLEVYGLLALRDPQLPEPVLQYRVRDHHGRIVQRVDAAWPAARIAVEFDGAAYHGSPSQQARDRRGRERLRSLGWVVIVVTALDLTGGRLEALKDDLRRRFAAA